MARLGPAAKMRRVLELLIGLRDDRVLACLGDYGFTPADREQGWALLRALGLTQAVPVALPATHGALDALDAWRQRWFRLASVSLRPDYPRVHDKIFAGIHQMKQPAFAVVPVFVERVVKLAQARDASSREACAKLRRRGLTDERIAEARQLVTAVQNPVHRELPNLDERRAQLKAAEASLWKYYVEWSQVARTVIKDPRLLQLLGFRGGADDEAPAEPREQPASPVEAARAVKTKRRTRNK